MSARLSDYERRTREQIHNWKNPEQGWFGQTMRQIGWPVDRLGSLLQNATDAAGLSDVISKALAGLVKVLTDAAAWAVRTEAVYAEFRNADHDVRQPADLFALDLEQVDKVVGWLDAKYTGIAFTEGAAAGAVGVPGLVADIPALVALNLRAIAEYATYYGFDVASQRERLFAMHVLGLASSPSDAAKTPVMAHLARIAADAAKKKAWDVLRREGFCAAYPADRKGVGHTSHEGQAGPGCSYHGCSSGGRFQRVLYGSVWPPNSSLGWNRNRLERARPEPRGVERRTIQPLGKLMSVIAKAIADRESEIERLQAEISSVLDVNHVWRCAEIRLADWW